MRKLKVYLDTTIINFAVDNRTPREKELTLRFIAEIKQGGYEAFISNTVLFEINKAPKPKADELLGVIGGMDLEVLSMDDEAQALANKYIESGVIPAKHIDDARHIAIASVHNLDAIISWNFEHIVKLKTKREILGINALMGYKEIEIYSPLEVVSNE